MRFQLANALLYAAETLSRQPGEEREYFAATAVLDESLEVKGLGLITIGTFQLHRRNERNPIATALHYLEPSSQFAGSKGGSFAGYLSIEPALFDRWLALQPFGLQISISLDFGIGAPGLDFVAPDAYRWNVGTHRMLPALGASVVFEQRAV